VAVKGPAEDVAKVVVTLAERARLVCLDSRGRSLCPGACVSMGSHAARRIEPRSRRRVGL